MRITAGWGARSFSPPRARGGPLWAPCVPPPPPSRLVRGGNQRLHDPEEVRAQEAAAEEGAVEAGEVVGVRQESAGSPQDGRAANADVLERAEEVSVRVASGDPRTVGQGGRPQAQWRDDP